MRYKIINRKKLYATILADIIGNIVFLPKRLLKREGKIVPEDIREILVIRTAYIGDVIMTVPILKPLKKKFHNSRVSFLTSNSAAELLRGNPYIDEIITYDPFWFYNSRKNEYIEFIAGLKKKAFDLVIEARGDIREIFFLLRPLNARFKVSYKTGGGGCFLTHVVPYKVLKHKVEYHLDIIRHLGCNTEDIEWEVYLSEQEKDKVKGIIERHGIKRPFVSVHPGARVSLKRWMTERFAELCDSISGRYNLPVVLLGTNTETGLIGDIVGKMKHAPVTLTGELNLRELACILSETALFICNDSSPMHIAAAMKTPTVAVFGPSKSIETAPYRNIYRVVEKDFPCRYECDENSCRHQSYHACMKGIEVEDVLSEVEDILKGLKADVQV